MFPKEKKHTDSVISNQQYRTVLLLFIFICFSSATDYSTEFDGGIIIPNRSNETLYIMKGGTSSADRDWGSTSNPKNMLWKMPLKNAKGVSTGDMSKYNDLWRGSTSINDVKRVMYKGKIHLVVVGNGGDGLAMFEFDTKNCIYWSKTTAGGPHDVDFIPVGSGYIAVGNPSGSDYIEIYDINGGNNRGRISSVVHKGIHSVHWDAEQECLWGWGSGQSALKQYKFDTTKSTPELKLINSFPVDSDLFYVGTGHGGSPMLVRENGQLKRYLIFAGKSGIGIFDTEKHTWDMVQEADTTEDGESWTGLYSNPKGVSHNDVTGEIIFTKNSRSEVWSLENGTRKMDGAEIYKARWWINNEFSYPSSNSTIPEITTEKRDSTVTVELEGEAVITTELVGDFGKEDTVITTIVIDTTVDSTWSITDTLTDGVLTASSKAVFKEERKTESDPVVTVETKEFDQQTAIISVRDITSSSLGIAFKQNPVHRSDNRVEMYVGAPHAVEICVRVFDYLGQLIDEQELATHTSGSYLFTWDLRNRAGSLVGSGTYVVVAEIKMRDGSTLYNKELLGVQQ